MSNTPSDTKTENLGFTIENRAGADVVVWKEGGCRPATSAEIAMWKALSAVQQPVVRESSEDLYWRLHGLSKILEGSGVIDESRNHDAYPTILDAMAFVRGTPQPTVREPLAVPRFNCWSTNEGDSWFDHPADSQAIYDCLGNDAKVGDEYELTAGWTSVTARYRITEVVGDGEEYEVECISHPHENSAPQPSPAPLSESIDQLERELAIIGVVGAIDGYDVVRRESVLEIARRAAIAAQGGK